MSDLLKRVGLAIKAGLQFGGDRDLYAVYGYKQSLTYADFLERYKRQDIATRLIDAPVQATWRREPTVKDDNGPEGEFAIAWNAIVKQHKLYFNLERVDRLAGLGQYAVLLLGLSGDLGSPASKGPLLYLQPYGQGSTSIVNAVGDPANERFGKPEMYEITFSDPTAVNTRKVPLTTKSTDKKVHHSRILHVAEGVLEDEIFGLPRLQNVTNLLDDLLKVVGGSAETYWLTANRGMQFDVDKDAELDPDDEDALEAEIEEYQHNLRRFLRTRGVKINVLGAELADPTGPFFVYMALLAGARGIPVRILLGSERGELASEQDRANWANRIEERQKSYAGPMILEPLLEKLINLSVLREPKGDIVVTWPDAFAPSPLERAQTMAQKARAATNLAKALENPSSFITSEEAREIMGLEPKADTNFEEVEDDVDTPEEDAEGRRAAVARPIKLVK